MVDIRDFVHLALLAMEGKELFNVQRTIYFLGVMTDFLPKLGYHSNFNRFYSNKVADALAELKELGFTSKLCTDLSMEGRIIAKKKSQKNIDFWNKLTCSVEIIKEIKGCFDVNQKINAQ